METVVRNLKGKDCTVAKMCYLVQRYSDKIITPHATVPYIVKLDCFDLIFKKQFTMIYTPLHYKKG